ncbi:MAG TPA: HEAT repeat domain-containing protein [Gemmatimonadaceae bacterium]|nr:HEAT repeat domain-containing protein [Gemmatimonadaceae bacterium]
MSAIRVSGSNRFAAEAADRGGPAAAVEEMLKLLGKASRAHQLYLHNNPTYLRALDLLRGSFDAVWEQVPELTLTVGEHELLWEERPVYQEHDRGGASMPWLLFKDGVRELRLLPGFENQEVERLLDVLRLLSRASASEDDAITLLWERDFAFLRYRFVEPLGDEEGPSFTFGPTPGRLALVDGAPPPDTPSLPSTVRMADFDGTPYFLAERELAYLRDALEREYAHDLHADVAAMLLDTFESQPSPRARAQVCAAVEELLLHALGTGSYRAVARLLREVATSLQRTTNVEPGHRQRLEALAAQFSTDEGLGRLVEALDVVEALPPDDELEALFGQLPREALGPVLRLADGVQTVRLRNALRAAAERLVLAHSGELVRLIGSPDPVVAREAVRRAGALKVAPAVPALGTLLTQGGGELRALAAQALSEIGSTGALQLLAGALGDAEREVRLVALRAVGRGYRAASALVEALVRDRRTRDADRAEQLLIFETYGALCGDDGIPLLDGLLNGRSLIGRRQDPALRACAAVALGRVGTEAARAALARAAEEKDVVVRSAVQRALRGAA